MVSALVAGLLMNRAAGSPSQSNNANIRAASSKAYVRFYKRCHSSS